MKEDKTYILWTGGWDSTFRLLQLAEKSITIQPLYVVDSSRAGRKNEMKAMEKIRNEIIASNWNKATILEIKQYSTENIKRDEEIIQAYERIRSKYNIGSQYCWLAELCKMLDIERVEVGFEFSDRSKIKDAIWSEGSIIDDNSVSNGIKRINCEESSKDIQLLFKYYVFGLADVSKKDAENISREKGWLDIMKYTWFCHMPIHGKPCGMCNPCKDAMNEGMEWRMPPISQFRYRHSQSRIVSHIANLQRLIFGE